jgi:hypothetical protein
VRTSEPVTPAQAEAFTVLMERAYLSTHTTLRQHPPGGPFIVDESAGSSSRKPQPTEIHFNPFGPVDEVQGMLQYLPMEGTINAVRAVMVPVDMGESQIDLVDMPQ